MKVFLYKWKYWGEELSFYLQKWKWNESRIKENKAWGLDIWFYPLSIHLDIPISIDWEEILLLSNAQPINSIDINRFCKKAE